MSEFTKLGGYLIQGQPEVVHDSALSGNGLEGSPLGLSEEFITGTMRPATQSALNLNIGHPENNSVAEVGATIGSNNTAASTGLAVGFGASAFGMSIAVGENAYASNRGIAVGRGVDANGIAAFGTYNAEINTGHDCIFVVGNGTDSANRSDAFKIYKDGRVVAPNFVTTNNVHLSALTGVSEANDLVHSNSGTWDGVSAKLDTTASSNFYTTANESGFITGVPTGTMNESAFSYDASNNITAYNGSAFKAGDEFPQSATEAIETVTANSADWNGTTETVSSNSGAWGGSALPISAGPGIKFEMIDNTLVASTDETVLWSGNLSSKNTEITLLDSLKNYNSYKIYGYNTENKYGVVSEFTYNSAGPNWFSITNTRIQDNSYLTIYGSVVSANTNWNKLKITYMSNKYCISGGITHSTGYGVGITKIVGINRIAGV
jgi:hypothetical protein